MKHRFLSILLSLACVWPVVNLQAEDNRAHTLKVYNWADYLDMDLIAEFETWYEEQTGESVKVIYETFDINENMLTEIEIGHEDYDVICPSEYIIERMLNKGLLQPIQKDYAEGTPVWLDCVSPFVVEKFEQMGVKAGVRVADYAVGYMWGTTGVLYNPAFVTAEEVSTWGILHDSRFYQKILMKDAFRDIYSTLICYARYDDIVAGHVTRDEVVADLSDENIRAVEEVLLNAKPQIAGWEVDFGKERMTQGKAWVNITWSGDAVWAIDEAAEVGVELDYVVPYEGSNCWFDGWAIPTYARNVKAASYWINFMCKPEHAIRNMDATGYVSVIATSEVMEAMVDEEIEETYDLSYFFGDSIGADSLHIDPILYPDRTVVERCALMHDCADRNEAMIEMWSRVKGNNLDTKMLTFIISVFVLIILVVVWRRVKKYRMRQRRRHRLQMYNKRHKVHAAS